MTPGNQTLDTATVRAQLGRYNYKSDRPAVSETAPFTVHVRDASAMLRELHIKNLALIADAEIRLAPGLNVFTGATGAGKSLVLGALELLLGGRAKTDMVRPGASEARVNGVFELADASLQARLAARLDRDVDSFASDDLIIGRRMTATGRTSYTVGGEPVTASVLRTVAEQLVDIHGQHEHQRLLTPAYQVDLLDCYADGGALRAEYARIWFDRRALLETRQRFSHEADIRRQQLELFGFQADEIDAACLREGEWEELDGERRRLANVEKLRREAGRVLGIISESDINAVDLLREAAGLLDVLAGLDEELKPAAEAVRSAAADVAEVSKDLAAYADELEFDPDRLAEVDERLHRVRRLVDKYAKAGPRGNATGGTSAGIGVGAGSIAAVLAYRAGLAEKLARLQKETADQSVIDARLAQLERELLAVGERLRSVRFQAGARLAAAVERELAELGMEHARFLLRGQEQRSEPARLETATAMGLDPEEMEFLIAPNPGVPAAPLRKIASGGELSRVMLALKGILADNERVAVLIFDEIDSNIGGRLGDVIGTKLRQLARRHQVICITHLPQIAAYADRQFTVRKQVVAGESLTTVTAVDGRERLDELAEMISGKNPADVTYRQVEEMLARAQRVADSA